MSNRFNLSDVTSKRTAAAQSVSSKSTSSKTSKTSSSKSAQTFDSADEDVKLSVKSKSSSSAKSTVGTTKYGGTVVAMLDSAITNKDESTSFIKNYLGYDADSTQNSTYDDSGRVTYFEEKGWTCAHSKPKNYTLEYMEDGATKVTSQDSYDESTKKVSIYDVYSKETEETDDDDSTGGCGCKKKKTTETEESGGCGCKKKTTETEETEEKGTFIQKFMKRKNNCKKSDSGKSSSTTTNNTTYNTTNNTSVNSNNSVSINKNTNVYRFSNSGIIDGAGDDIYDGAGDDIYANNNSGIIDTSGNDIYAKNYTTNNYYTTNNFYNEIHVKESDDSEKTDDTDKTGDETEPDTPTYESDLMPLRSLLTNLEVATPDGVLSDEELSAAMNNPTIADMDGDTSNISTSEMAVFNKIKTLNEDKDLISNIIKGDYTNISTSKMEELVALSNTIKGLKPTS